MLNKIKKLLARQRHGNEKLKIEMPGSPPQDARIDRDRDHEGWLSPQYTQSQTAYLDPAFIARNRCFAYLKNVPEAEAYRLLRSKLLHRTRGTAKNAIMVTSALPGEGKTITAINLSFTLAREYQHTVMLVDGDLRNQSIYKYLGWPGEKGLIDYLVGDSLMSDLIIWPGIEKITVISGGRPYLESAAILGSPRMKKLIADMKVRYADRYLIFDAPPVLTCSDVLTLAHLVDGVIIVVQAGKTSISDVRKAIQFLPQEKILGFVLNRCSETGNLQYPYPSSSGSAASTPSSGSNSG